MAIVFDGKKFAAQKESQLKHKVKSLKNEGITPRLVSILVGNDRASELYTSLKKKAVERIGAIMEIKSFPSSVSVEQLSQYIGSLNSDISVHGIMIQMPLPTNLEINTEDLINTIQPNKDVDGMREDGLFLPATVKSVIEIVSLGEEYIKSDNYPYKFVVVGAKGFVGKRLVRYLLNDFRRNTFLVVGLDLETADLKEETKEADILVSATGKSKLIKADMVKRGAIVIDVGAPLGDIDFTEVSKKAGFITPVPGGVGPVTISSLLENLVIASERSI